MARTVADPPAAAARADSAGGFHFDSWVEAHAEAARRRSNVNWEGFMTRVVKSGYGGFVVRSWPTDLLIEACFSHHLGRTRPDHEQPP